MPAFVPAIVCMSLMTTKSTELPARSTPAGSDADTIVRCSAQHFWPAPHELSSPFHCSSLAAHEGLHAADALAQVNDLGMQHLSFILLHMLISLPFHGPMLNSVSSAAHESLHAPVVPISSAFDSHGIFIVGSEASPIVNLSSLPAAGSAAVSPAVAMIAAFALHIFSDSSHLQLSPALFVHAGAMHISLLSLKFEQLSAFAHE